MGVSDAIIVLRGLHIHRSDRRHLVVVLWYPPLFSSFVKPPWSLCLKANIRHGNGGVPAALVRTNLAHGLHVSSARCQ